MKQGNDEWNEYQSVNAVPLRLFIPREHTHQCEQTDHNHRQPSEKSQGFHFEQKFSRSLERYDMVINVVEPANSKVDVAERRNYHPSFGLRFCQAANHDVRGD